MSAWPSLQANFNGVLPPYEYIKHNHIMLGDSWDVMAHNRIHHEGDTGTCMLGSFLTFVGTDTSCLSFISLRASA